MTLYQILQQSGLPCVYSHFRKKDAPISPPFIAYIGTGQRNFDADNTHYHSENTYRVEFYFTEKDETAEAAIEKLLLDNGFLYEKSEDLYIEDEGVFMITYDI